MKIGIIGATGHVGQAITTEALDRGHEVTAIVRNAGKATDMFGEQTKILAKDALALTKDDLTGLDVIIDAFASQAPYEQLDLATHLVSLYRADQTTKLMFVIGSSTLQKADGTTLLSDTLKRFAAEPWIASPIQQDHELHFLQWVDNVDWTAVTPSTDFVDGPKTSYKIGGDQVMTNAAGKAVVTIANYAAAMLAEVEQPAHSQQRFTVVDA
ncbi:NAD(P)H-binding protein [Lacticaseibacillus zhaodongensis]|uniref:NAD(P)H-binding protein n=1 Tax=Lacticaseibacillus zhaodongensis TaxID=2668065 RepID=UPI0012D35721|nr:NAD(P)H-binding protein [Lacticaseibacillus zhaodongensis]